MFKSLVEVGGAIYCFGSGKQIAGESIVTPIDVAILDVNLGGETSEPVARKLQESDKPFVVLSGYSTENKLPWFGDAPVLPKPLRMDDLVAALRGCIDDVSHGTPHRM